MESEGTMGNSLSLRPGAVASMASRLHCCLEISIKFIPAPSPGLIETSLPARMEGTKLETSAIWAVFS